MTEREKFNQAIGQLQATLARAARTIPADAPVSASALYDEATTEITTLTTTVKHRVIDAGGRT